MKFGFLPVGHTHEDIDQRFSCVSRLLNHRNVLTIPGEFLKTAQHKQIFYQELFSISLDLVTAVQASLTPEPTLVVLENVVDAKTWMADQTPPLHDHLKAHQFKFERNSVGETKMFYKEWSTDTFWLPDGGLSMFPVDNPIPKRDPKILVPFFDAETLGKIETTVAKVGAYLDRAGASSWWNSWFDKARKFTDRTDPQVMQGIYVKFICNCTACITCIFCTHRYLDAEVSQNPFLRANPYH